MQHGATAHGAGFQRDVQRTAFQPVVAQRAGGCAHSLDFCVGGRVVVGNAAVMAPAQDGVTVRANDDGAYRDFGLGGGLFGFGQGLAHERRRGW